jgi:hypothetical protein
MERNLFKVIFKPINKGGRTKIYSQTLVRAEGMPYINNLVANILTKEQVFVQQKIGRVWRFNLRIIRTRLASGRGIFVSK